MILLSTHFSLQEFLRSEIATRKGIDNTPTDDVLENLRVLAQGLERVRTVLGAPVRISSGYRCPELNAAIGGAKDSKHMLGLAADIECQAWGDPKTVFERLAAQREVLEFDQLILEFPPDGWVHVGFAEPGHMKRGDLLVYRGGSYERYFA